MTTISTLSVALTANTGGFRKAMQGSTGAVASFSQRVKQSGAGVVQTLGQIGLAAQGLKTIVGAIGGMIGGPLKLAAEAEQTAVSFEVLLNSAEDAKAVLNDIRTFAASTPFQFPDLADAGKKLIAFGTSGKQVAPTLKRLGELSAGLNIPIGELSEIYGKARVQGRLFMEDINQLAGRGIPIQTALAEIFHVQADEVRNLVSTGKVNFGHLERAFKNLTEEGGKFEGLIGKQSQTLAGVWSTLKDNVTASMSQIGTSISEGLNLKGMISKATVWVQEMAEIFGIMAQDWSATWEIMGLKAQSVMAQVSAYVRSEFDNMGESTRGWVAGLVAGLERFNPFGIGEGNLANENKRNAMVEQLQQEQRTILERSERRGFVSDADSARSLQISKEVDQLLQGNLDFAKKVHDARDAWNKAADAAEKAAKPFEDEIAKRWAAMRKRFEESRISESGGTSEAEASRMREVAARNIAKEVQTKAPGTLELGSAEAMRALAKYSQPKAQMVEKQQLDELRRIGNAIEAPAEEYDL